MCLLTFREEDVMVTIAKEEKHRQGGSYREMIFLFFGYLLRCLYFNEGNVNSQGESWKAESDLQWLYDHDVKLSGGVCVGPLSSQQSHGDGQRSSLILLNI